jgi:hypothetical protein
MNTITANLLPASPRPIDRCVKTSRVTIGIAYVPTPRRQIGSEAERLQRALLDPRTARPAKAWESVVGAVVAWL